MERAPGNSASLLEELVERIDTFFAQHRAEFCI
jgi:hypothetical protein